MRWIMPLGLACAALTAQSPKVKVWVGARPSGWEYRETRPFQGSDEGAFRIPLFLVRNDRSPRKDWTPGAVVEVWGDAPWARQDEFKAFVRTNLPAFRNAFDSGLGASIGGQMLAEQMAHPGDLHWNPAPAFAPSVWSNSQDPWARDRRFFR